MGKQLLGSKFLWKISVMQSEERANLKTAEPTGVQKDSETPIPQKPSFLFLGATAIGVITILVVAASAYYGITH
jgi:hypothetical protein